MPTNRDTYKYHLKDGSNTILHTGITNDLQRRESEHQQTYKGKTVHIKQVGNRTTRPAAFQWEAEQRAKGKPTES